MEHNEVSEQQDDNNLSFKNESKELKNVNNVSINRIPSTEQEFNLNNLSINTLYGNNYLNYFNSSKSCMNNPKIKKMGNLNVYFFIGKKPLIAINTTNITLAIIYEIIINTSFYILLFTILNQIIIYLKYLLILLYLICFICHNIIVFINPGIPSIDNYSRIVAKSENFMKLSNTEKENCYQCDICNIICMNPMSIEHCDDCNICINRYDHHCSWTGKCISSKNLWAFFLFGFGSMIYLLLYFIILIVWMVQVMDNSEKSKK